MSTKFLSPGWRMPRNANQSKQSNYSMDFDTSSTHIEFTTIQLNTTKSVSFWVNWNTTITGVMLGGGSGNYYPQIHETGGATRFYVRDTGGVDYYTYNSLLNTNQWYHVCITGNGTTAKVYLDGSLIGTMTDYTPALKYINTENGSQYGMVGKLDAVCIFDYELSSSQVTTLYGTGSAIGNPMALQSPPVAYYPLGESAGGFVGGSGTWLTENNAIGDYVFDNIVSSRIFTPINVSNLTNCTQAVWFKTSTNGQSNKQIFYVGQYGTFVLQFNGTDTLRAGVTVNPLTQTYPSLTFNYADGKWHQYVMNYDGSHIKLYIDGVLKIKTARTGTLRNEPTYFTTIGNVSNPSSNAGAIGECSNFIAYEHTLTDGSVSVGDTATGEIAALYNYGSPIRTLASIPQSSNLKAWYKLDASEVYNSSTTEWSIDNNQNPSAYPSSLNFTNDVVQSAFPGPASLNSSVFSYSIWVKVITSAGFEEVLMGNFNGTGADIRFKGNENRIYFRTSYSNQTYQDEALVDDGGWHHIVATCDGTNLKIYVDKAKGTDGTGSYTSNTLVFKVGGGAQGSMQNVLISNACYFNTALSQSEIDTLHNNGTPLTDMSSFSSLVSWWKLNNMSAGIQDSKGSNNLSGSGPTEYAGFVNALAGDSSGMSQANLVQSDLQTVAPYSKYAMNFDGASSDYIKTTGNTIMNGGTQASLSVWINTQDKTQTQGILSTFFGKKYVEMILISGGLYCWMGDDTSTTNYNTVNSSNLNISNDTWFHLTYVFDGSQSTDGTRLKAYKNGTLLTWSAVRTIGTTLANDSSIDFYIGASGVGNGSYTFNGSLSNPSIWNAALTSAQVTEIYNQGLPSNLNSHSAYSNLVSWWQLGENSSFDGNDWIVADEKGTNNGTSTGMPVGALVNGVGTTANGVSSGMSEGNLIGDAPYSTANALSTNMVVTSRVSGVSDAAITTGGTGYVTGTNIATTGGSGTNCTINITTVSGGVITAITINNGGSNYVIGDVLTISGGNGNATITVSGLNTP